MYNYLVVKGINKFISPTQILNKNNCVDLSRFKHLKRVEKYTNYGISSDRFGLVWFMTDKGKALFKTFDSHIHYNIRNLRIINELV